MRERQWGGVFCGFWSKVNQIRAHGIRHKFEKLHFLIKSISISLISLSVRNVITMI